MTVGERIKEARKKANMTQNELAQKMGIPFQSISQWERDLRKPKYETLARIATALGCNIGDLTGASFTEGDTFWDGHLEVTDVDLSDSGGGDCEVGFKFDTTGLSLEQLKTSLELFFKMQDETGVVIKDAKGIPLKDSCEIKRLIDSVAEREKAKTSVED